MVFCSLKAPLDYQKIFYMSSIFRKFSKIIWGAFMVDTIRRLCKEQGKSLFSLEQECGLGNGSINKWDRSSPSVAKVRAVADALGVSVSYLIGGQEKKPTPKDGDGPALDARLVECLIQLSPEEQEKVEAFVQGMIAGRDTNGTR